MSLRLPHRVQRPLISLALGALACLAVTAAQAGGVSWSIGINAPIAPGVSVGTLVVGGRDGMMVMAPPVYAAAPVAYVQQPVYAPAPVYVPPRVVYQTVPEPYYEPAPVAYVAAPVYQPRRHGHWERWQHERRFDGERGRPPYAWRDDDRRRHD